jgi:hypothetical protein
VALLIRLLLCALVIAAPTARADDLASLDHDFWAFRALEQPFTDDDIPRIERPAGFRVDWSPAAVDRYRRAIGQFEARWLALAPPADAPAAHRTDYRLVGSALARVRFELDVSRSWQRHPGFYIDQSLGSMYAELLSPPPFDAKRLAVICERLDAIPETLEAARHNLIDLRRPFVDLALGSLQDIEARLTRFGTAFAPQVPLEQRPRLQAGIQRAAAALVAYRDWLQTQRAGSRADTAIGRAGYEYFLHNVALLPETPESMLTKARAEWSRAVGFETLEENRLSGTPPQTVFGSSDAQIAAERLDEEAVRHFLVEHHLLSVPNDIPHYRNLLLPAYLEPLTFLGETDDLTGPSRLEDSAVSYIRAPRPDLPYFYLSTARDPRPIIVHEGVPGHYFQLSLGWRHPDPIRRHYYDSSANEGIGFYAEEMMLEAGLFNDRPRTRSTIYSFMRLRALRVEVDVRLALGEMTVRDAADYLQRTVPMDHDTALEEAAFFAGTPGQAISYQIGKTEILSLLADVRLHDGDTFSLQAFHDRLWQEGNVPIALQRDEWLSDPHDIPAILPTPGVSP